jgi:hypothetical protein
MSKRPLWLCALCGALSAHCSNSTPGSTSSGASSLVGTWHLTTTPTTGSAVSTTVTIGQDSLSITSPDFTLTAVRTGNVLSFTDTAPPNIPAAASVLAATQTAGTFNAGIVPFDLGGSWTMQAGPKGGATSVTCTLQVSAAEIDGSCQFVSPVSPWFTFTSGKTNTATSSFGDFGGKWTNTWTWQGTNGGTFPCALDFAGNGITTCSGGGPVNGQASGNPLAGIAVTYDGANTVSGSAHGWAEFSASR